jgi:hypothetical protein
MFRRIPGLLLWIIVACAVATVPMACSESDDGGSDASTTGNGSTDGPSVNVPDTMTAG